MVLNESLSRGLAINTAAILGLTLGRKLDGIVGPDLKDASGEIHPGITTIPIPILRASGAVLKDIRLRASRMPDLYVVDFTDAAQTTKNYDAYTEKLSAATLDDLEYLGLALCGAPQAVNTLTGSLPLLR